MKILNKYVFVIHEFELFQKFVFYQITPYTKEIRMTITQEYDTIFNDTSIHLFPDTLLQKADSRFWIDDVVEPIANSDDVEIVKRKLCEEER